MVCSCSSLFYIYINTIKHCIIFAKHFFMNSTLRVRSLLNEREKQQVQMHLKHYNNSNRRTICTLNLIATDRGYLYVDLDVFLFLCLTVQILNNREKPAVLTFAFYVQGDSAVLKANAEIVQVQYRFAIEWNIITISP